MSKIEWTEDTWNPFRARGEQGTGWQCEKVSPGCKNCYAENMNRWRGTGSLYTPAGARKVELYLDAKKLAEPLRWRKPRMVFPCSMTDLFYERHTNEEIAAVFGVMAATPQHTYQVLTKRPERMLDWFRWLDVRVDEMPSLRGMRPEQSRLVCWQAAQDLGATMPGGWHGYQWPLPNVWLGVSAEDQATADERIPLLLQCPAAVRWVSAEPLLGPIDFRQIRVAGPLHAETHDALSGHSSDTPFGYVRTGLNDPLSRGRLAWLVVGGESGPKARPCDVAWIRSIRDQCRAAGVPPFVKQLGGDPRSSLGSDHPLAATGRGWDGTEPATGLNHRLRFRDRKGGDWNEWPEDLRVRDYPQEVAS